MAMSHTRSRRRWLARAGVLAVVLALAAACGDDNGNNNSSGNGGSGSDEASNADVCTQVDDLKNAITDLSNVDVSEEGTNALDDAVGNIEQQADDLGSAVSEDAQPQVDDFKSSLTSLKDALGNLGEEGSVSAVVDALQEVLTTSEALFDKVTSADC